MQKILISGATGNVGTEVIKHLATKEGDFRIIAGTRKGEERFDLAHKRDIQTVRFDFSDLESLKSALAGCHSLFLLRPPQISDVQKYFQPLIRIAEEKQLKHIVFLSVQGAENSSFIPHHKIEKLIINSNIAYTFLRPAYFMQNFTTTLREDLVEKNRIYMPAGKAKFTLIDVEDVGAVAAEILKNPARHKNEAYDLTNDELLNFEEMADILSQVLERKISYKSPDLLSFYLTKRKQGTPHMYILVMIMLHYLHRFKSAPERSKWVEKLTGRKPRTFREFVKTNQHLLEPPQ